MCFCGIIIAKAFEKNQLLASAVTAEAGTVEGGPCTGRQR
jgi:hypothetical protein